MNGNAKFSTARQRRALPKLPKLGFGGFGSSCRVGITPLNPLRNGREKRVNDQFHAVFPGFAMVTVALKTAQKAQFSAIALLQKALAKAK